MLEKVRCNKDKEQGAREALAVYYVHRPFLERVAGVLQEIRDLVELLEESLEDIKAQRDNQEAKAKRISKGSLVSKLVPCGKHCSGCPHGPYLYRVTKANGKAVWQYIGKASK
ncbi:MAG: hypothetical protein ABSA75_07325 [Candidatus Bathyarchaeia archaeon]